MVILVDGAMRRRRLWGGGPPAAERAAGFTVYTYDRRGRGVSTDTRPYALEREIEDLGDGSLPLDDITTATMPVLILDGGESPAFMRVAAEALARAMPQAQRKTLEGQTHLVSPQTLAPVLATFFG